MYNKNIIKYIQVRIIYVIGTFIDEVRIKDTLVITIVANML